MPTFSNPDYLRQVKELQELKEQVWSVQKLKNPSEIKSEFNNIQNQLNVLKEKIEKIEKIQSHILKSQTKISQEKISDSLDGISKDIKENVKKGLTDLEIDLMKLELEFYKPDLKHLHRSNLEEANNTMED